MTTLQEHLPLAEKRQEILGDCQQFLEAEISRKGGLSGLAVKAAYKVLKAIRPGAVIHTMDSLLDDFLVALEPFHEKYLQQTDNSLGQVLRQNTSQVAEALLSVTDEKAHSAKHGTLLKAYRKLRPSAKRHVEESVPGLSHLIESHYRTNQ